jgi:hypothetical protein
LVHPLVTPTQVLPTVRAGLAEALAAIAVAIRLVFKGAITLRAALRLDQNPFGEFHERRVLRPLNLGLYFFSRHLALQTPPERFGRARIGANSSPLTVLRIPLAQFIFLDESPSGRRQVHESTGSVA